MDLNRMIAERAYQLWVDRGRPHGSHEDDWREAERQLAGEQRAAPVRTDSDQRDSSLAHTFPASDPPASRLPDTPPSNAADKWAAARKKDAPRQTDAAARNGKKPESGARRPVDETDNGPPTAPNDIGEG
ncbi:MAG TPA: DUF2934 domain-containing protein [Steroidobacteraceae bacterium]|jgi:hypothetical protein